MSIVKKEITVIETIISSYAGLLFGTVVLEGMVMVFLGETGRLLCRPFPMTAINSDGLIPPAVFFLKAGGWKRNWGTF